MVTDRLAGARGIGNDEGIFRKRERPSWNNLKIDTWGKDEESL
jgi:hypothetical protein